MIVKEPPAVRSLDSIEDFSETRLEAIGFIFHGVVLAGDKPLAIRSTSNLLHFARCTKLERALETESKLWFRSIKVAIRHLDENPGKKRWKWCKICEREITQRILDEA